MTLTINKNLLIEKLDERNYLISAGLLLTNFENSIQEYRKDILSDHDLNKNIEHMFLKYGYIGLK